MKKVFIISTSPRKGGNSDTLAEKFVKGAEAGDHVWSRAVSGLEG